MAQKPDTCLGCPLYDQPMVWGTGSPSATLVMIGQCPGPEEVQAKEPFVGGAGRILNRALHNVGASRTHAFVTNAVKCYVKPRTPVPAEALRKCQPLLKKELKQVPNAHTILTLGQEAYTAVSGGLKLHLVHDRRASKGARDYRIRGCPDTVHYDGRAYTIVPTFHPIFLAYSGFALSPVFESDVARAFRFAHGTVKLAERSIDPNPSPSQIRQTVCDVLRSGEGGVDIETPWSSEDEEDPAVSGGFLPIREIGLSPGSAAYAISVKPENYEHLRPLFDVAARAVLPADLQATVPVLWAHGSAFDFYHLSGLYALDAVREACSLQAFHLLQPDAMKKDIVACCAMYTDLPFWKYLAGVNDDLYNAYDTWGTVLAGQAMLRAMRALDKSAHERFRWLAPDRGLEWVFWNHQMPASQITRNWEHQGAAYDQDKSDELELYIREVISAYEDQWDAVLPGVNWASSKQLVELFTAMGLKVPLRARHRVDKVTGERTEYKSPSVDDNALAGFARAGNEVAKLVQLLREYKKAADFLGQANQDPERGALGRIYFRAKPHAQAGGRIQTVDDNLQQLPEDIAGINPRLTIICEDTVEDVLISADFSQIEFWLYSWYAKCHKALQIKESGEYLYGQFYEDIWQEPFFLRGKPREKKNRDEARTPAWKLLVAKSWPLGFIYGRGAPDPTEQQLPITAAKAKSIHGKFHADYPEYRKLHSELELLVSRHGLLQTCFGRLRRFSDPKKDRNEYLAFPGQSTAVDVLISRALVPLSAELPRLFGERSKILFTVHDSVVANVKIVGTDGKPSMGKVIDAYDLIKSSMEAPIPEMQGFSISAELKIGRSWGDGKSIEKYALPEVFV